MTLNIKNIRELVEYAHEFTTKVHGANAKGHALHSNGHLGADMLYVPAHQQFPVHTHPGDHLLLCVKGTGTITIGQVTYHVKPGDLYMVDGLIPHAVGAGDDPHVLVAIGAPHKPIDSTERMEFTDWAGRVLAEPLYESNDNRTQTEPS